LATDEGKIEEHGGGIMKRSFLVDGDAVNIILAINNHITDEESCKSWNTSVGQIVVCR